MLDWARTGFWRPSTAPTARRIFGQRDSSDNLRPMRGQYFDLACCCCSPYVIAVVAHPPADVVPSFSFKAHNRDFATFVSGGMLFYYDNDLESEDSEWEQCTAIIDPDTNTEVSGRWMVRRLDLSMLRAWRFEFGPFADDVSPSVQTCVSSIGTAFKDGGIWVTRSIPAWIKDTTAGSGYFRNYENVIIPGVGDNATTRTFTVSRSSVAYADGGFFYTSH